MNTQVIKYNRFSINNMLAIGNRLGGHLLSLLGLFFFAVVLSASTGYSNEQVDSLRSAVKDWVTTAEELRVAQEQVMLQQAQRARLLADNAKLMQDLAAQREATKVLAARNENLQQQLSNAMVREQNVTELVSRRVVEPAAMASKSVAVGFEKGVREPLSRSMEALFKFVRGD